ncbi:MAG: hypothetical protein ILP11_03605, partial [Alphaproteobacteria bacterium]|nr:hypothetical protein [Alphaproteobacteria bacterium]
EEFDLSEYQPNNEAYPNIQIAGYAGSFEVSDKTTAFEVTLTDIEKAVCDKIMNSGWDQPYMIYVNNMPNGACEDTNAMIFAFNNTLDTEAPACNPRNGWNDDHQRCEPCADGYGKDGDQCAQCPADTYQYGDECRDCPAGSETEAGATECPCPANRIWNAEAGTCDLCPANTYKTDDYTCKACPEGATSAEGSVAGDNACTCPGSTWVANIEQCDPPLCKDRSACASWAADANGYACEKEGNAEFGVCNKYYFRKWIEGTGSQYFDPELTLDEYDAVIAQFENTDLTQNRCWFWGVNHDDSQVGWSRSQISYSQSSFLGYGGNGYVVGTPTQVFGKELTSGPHVIRMENKKFYVDNDVANFTGKTYTYSTESKTCIFCCVGNAGNFGTPSKAKMWYFQAYKNGELVAEYKPAVNYQNKPGIYDTQEDVMYYNKGSGECNISAD